MCFYSTSFPAPRNVSSSPALGWCPSHEVVPVPCVPLVASHQSGKQQDWVQLCWFFLLAQSYLSVHTLAGWHVRRSPAPSVLWYGRRNGFSYSCLDLVGTFLPKATLRGGIVQITAPLGALWSVDPSFLSWMCLWRDAPDPEAQEENATKEEGKSCWWCPVPACLITWAVLGLTSRMSLIAESMSSVQEGLSLCAAPGALCFLVPGWSGAVHGHTGYGTVPAA